MWRRRFAKLSACDLNLKMVMVMIVVDVFQRDGREELGFVGSGALLLLIILQLAYFSH